MSNSDHCCSHGDHTHDHSTTSDNVINTSKKSISTTANVNIENFSQNDGEVETKTVSQLFDIVWSIQNELQDTRVDTTSDDYVKRLYEQIRLLKSLEQRLTTLDLFSDNEHYDELSTTNIRYLLLYAFLGWLYQTKRSKPSLRLQNVQQACDYYRKFLTVTKNYSLHQQQIPEQPSIEPGDSDNNQIDLTASAVNGSRNLMKMAQDRAAKIRGHLKRKEEEEEMKAFEEAVKRDTTDDEVKRKFYLSKIHWWINTAFDDIDYLYDELKVLQQRSLQQQSSANEDDDNSSRSPSRKSPSSRPLKPILLTRDQLQSQVFGAGYPSVSTMTVDEFYQNLTKQGLMPTEEQSKQQAHAPMTFPSASDFEKETIAKEEHVERDDPNMIEYLRSKDDYRDEHLRGEGNRKNRS